MHKDDISSSQDYELISKAYYDLLWKEKIEILNNILPVIRQKVQIARELGDLSENAEYQSEINKKIRYEQRLDKINKIINTAIVFDITTQTNKESIHIGAYVKLFNMNSKKEMEVQIVSSFEASPSYNKISYKSHVAKTIIGKKENDIVEIGENKIKIIQIRYE